MPESAPEQTGNTVDSFKNIYLDAKALTVAYVPYSLHNKDVILAAVMRGVPSSRAAGSRPHPCVPLALNRLSPLVLYVLLRL